MPKKNPSRPFDRNREFAVILEDIRSQIGVVIEEQRSMKDDIKILRNELGHQKEELYLIKTDIRIIKEDLNAFRKILKIHDKRLSRLEISSN